MVFGASWCFIKQHLYNRRGLQEDDFAAFIQNCTTCYGSQHITTTMGTCAQSIQSISITGGFTQPVSVREYLYSLCKDYPSNNNM